MNFKTFFYIYESTQMNKHSWLNPSGIFFPLEQGQTHSDWAQKKVNAENNHYKDTIHVLMKKGWQRITYIHPSLIANNEFMLPNAIQLKATTNESCGLKMIRIK